MSRAQRLLDANANRAREALRVMEDAARFLLDDAPLSASLKQLRHDLAEALRGLPSVELSRNTPGDVGTAITTEAETQRGTTRDVALAAGKRLSEALRCLEEFGKLHDTAFAARIERCRYRGYELETQLVARVTVGNPAGWRLCFLVTESLCTHHGWLAVVQQAVAAGVDCVQLREKGLTDRELLERAERLVACAKPRAAVVINDRPDIALLAGADGVHLGQGDLSVGHVRRIAGRELLVGVSTHDLDEAQAAAGAGADYCGVGAVFATSTKDRSPSGLAYVTQFVERHGAMPHLAIGGITPDNIDQVVAAGARGVAVSSCVCGAEEPGLVVKNLLKNLNQT